MNKVKWISHRGESAIAPENTVSAHRLARELGSDGSECDVWLTKDGKVIVCHNPTTGMMADRDLDVQGSTFDELRALTVANADPAYQHERFATLAEIVAELGPGRELYLELKGKDLALVPAVVAEVKAIGLEPERCVFIGFDALLMQAVKAALPQYRMLYLTAVGYYPRVEELIAMLHAIHADGVDIAWSGESTATKEYYRALHDAGFYISVWTIDFPCLAKRFIGYGADAITSNRAAALKKVLQA